MPAPPSSQPWRSLPYFAGALPLPPPALYCALGRRSPPPLTSAPLCVAPALSSAQCQGWRRLCTKNSAGTVRRSVPAKRVPGKGGGDHPRRAKESSRARGPQASGTLTVHPAASGACVLLQRPAATPGVIGRASRYPGAPGRSAGKARQHRMTRAPGRKYDIRIPRSFC